MKKILSLVIIFTMLSVICLSGCAIVDNTSIVTINGEKVMKDVYLYYLEMSKNFIKSSVTAGAGGEDFWKTATFDGKSAIDAAKEKALKETVDAVLYAQEAKKLGAVIDAKYVTDQINGIKTQAGSEQKYKEQLKSYNLTENGIKSVIEYNYLRQKLFELLSKTEPELDINDAKIKEYYDNNIIGAKHILFSKTNAAGQPAVGEELAAIRALADDTLVKIKGGANFDQLMKNLSKDPGLEANPDGYLFLKGEMVKPFENAAISLSIGQVSEIVETDYGFHIIKAVDPKPQYKKYIETMGSDGKPTNSDKIKGKIIETYFTKKVEEYRSASTIVANEKAISKIKVEDPAPTKEPTKAPAQQPAKAPS